MPTVRLSQSIFDIQIRIRIPKRISVLHVVFSLLTVLPKLIEQTIKQLQIAWMEDDLGPHGAVGNLFDEDGLECSECGSRRVNRKDWKVRHPVVPILGEITVPQRRVKCEHCDSVYKPYEDVLGLPKHKQYTLPALLEGVRNVMVTSYDRATSLASSTMSPKTLWRAVQSMTPTKESDDEEYALVVMDATDVPKWRESGQVTLTMAHEVSRGPEVYGRSTLEREVVALVSGSEEDIKECLEDPTIQGLMHDGKLRVDGLCEIEGRCLWHVPHTVRQLLYKDGISGERNKQIVGEVGDLVFDDELSEEQREDELQEWIDKHESEAPEAARHVELALEGLRNVQENPSLFELVSTSSMERMMVEINKRFENGGGWTQRGAESMLWHLQMWLIEPEDWLDQMTEDVESALPEFFSNSLI